MESQFTVSSIVFIVLLIVPGVFFKRFYFQGPFSKQFSAGLFADRIITSIFWGLFVQIITFLFFSQAFDISYDTVKKPLSEAIGRLSQNSFPDFPTEQILYFLAYLTASIFIAAFLGGIFHKLIRFFKIDVKFKVFRFSNQWDYYFRGDILDTRDFTKQKKGKWMSTMVDVVMDNGNGGTKMVSGFLTQYLLSDTGDLETIYITEASRYSNTRKIYTGIPGDCFVIPYNKVIDMNIRYNVAESRSKKILTISNFILVIGYLGVLSLFIFPWYLDVNFFRKVFGLLFGLISWFLFLAIIITPFQPKTKSTLELNGVVTATILSVIFGFVSVAMFKKLGILIDFLVFWN